MAKKPKQTGAQAFDAFYTDAFGERWPGLRQALLQEHAQVALTDNLAAPYYLDVASVLAAEALQVSPGMAVLDLCAAPGGKTLVLAQHMQGQGLLVANERSPERFFRLKRNLRLIKNLPTEGIRCTQKDAMRYALGYQGPLFDRILLDTPCSSEAHVLKSAYYLQQWGPRRAKRLAIEQTSMLCQALELCKPQGKIVYSTCSLNPAENDAVVARLLQKRPGYFTIEALQLSLGEPTQYGWQIWPDTHQQGPMYIARLKRISNSTKG